MTKTFEITKRTSFQIEIVPAIGVAIGLVPNRHTHDFVLIIPFLILTLEITKKDRVQNIL